MTREELKRIATRYANDELKDNLAPIKEIVAAAFLNGIDYAEQHPHWISVEEKMPPRWEKYPHLSNDVLSTDGISVNVNYYDYSDGEWAYGIGMHPITHWMPLPAPPGSSEIPNNHKKGDEE